MEEDIRLGVVTVPLAYSPRRAAQATFCLIAVTVAAALVLQPLSHLSVLSYLLPSAAVSVYLLLWPGLKLVQSPVPQAALALFNRASFYPPVMLALLIASVSLPF
ncbi:MAG: hypothetical protein M1370_12335 [Bacteroidetes bacterium]|nr:hypothetical protein [Bacteroidota bacterium]